ncbi:putative pre-rRNA processing protein Tsr1 [Hortaea werneckii]|uniref:Bms1-type G domain-containing protein n=2 Tax=Hortaea werneckii TaxID=91943 RepID=A0A3M7IDW5_HORWE|nr:putative pre-rRNA processing protein Tsr1 [Hortaea werneckii]OTA38898.1 hypothetical protein BTJ68_01466 [Hortaea werneckii EXF-2000]KAI6845444.1 putative pre-rRNA processing protein Tsr1 [Hortaea werneckii]KAI6921521.1 putative pre-rRNA processing protein Tsr1 [Hortaea werneckii]KAI6921910.1 putative pre-rRNA processing protein Tsr1 [Hortaea werneckii]
MAPMNTDHHHRSTTKGSNKPFKSRHSTKSALKEKSKGKVEMLEKGARKTPHQQVMSKFERKNHAKQVRQNKLGERKEEASVFQGKDGAPRIVAVIPLCADVKSNEVITRMNGSVDVEEERPANEGPWRVEVPRFKQKVQYLTPARALFACLDAARIADFVLFVLSAEEEVDEVGEQILRCIEGQGVSTVLTGVHNLDKVEPAKKRPDVAKSLKSFITHFFNEQEKVHDISSRQDCSNVMRSLCTTVPKGIRWREDRSWLLPEDVRWEGNVPVVTGTVRGKGLKADRLVQVGEWGDFQIDRITAAPLETRNKRTKASEMAVDSAEGAEQTLEEPSEEQDDVAELAPEEATMDDDGMSMAPTSMAPSERKHVLLDDHRYFDEEEKGVDALPRPKRLPRGTSKSQAVWYLGGQYDDDSGSDMEDVEPEDELDGDMDIMDAAGSSTGPPGEGDVGDAHMMEEGAPSEYPQSEMFDDAAPEDEAEQIAAYRKQRRDEAEDDLEFPDEIELHPHVNARERLARYRGLKNLRTSHWETEEDRPYEPEDWSRLLEVADYKSAKNRMLKDALSGGVKAGTRVNIYLRVNPAQVEALKVLPNPTAVISLLKHEHKQTAVNASMSLSSEYPEPLKSKEELIMQCGPRRLLINPLFSQAGNTPNDVHKFDRYIHPGRTAVASFVGPMIWGSVPCLYFKRPAPSNEEQDQDTSSTSGSLRLDLIATGTILPPSTNRIIAKRIILTGHPYKIHKKLVTIRYMFFNDADVEYFKALQLWTRRGRSGFIKEPLGTHGYFKATFDGKVNPLDAVAVSLYKRVWPRKAKAWRPGVEEAEEVPQLVGSGDGDGDGMIE